MDTHEHAICIVDIFHRLVHGQTWTLHTMLQSQISSMMAINKNMLHTKCEAVYQHSALDH